MIIPGLVSISFRHLKPSEIISLCVHNKLEAIEWGGDVHCPHGDVATAARVGENTRAYGIKIAAYGSYYNFKEVAEEATGKKTTDNGADPEPQHGLMSEANPGSKRRSDVFDDVLSSAVALKAPLIRVWAGWKPSAEYDRTERGAIIRKAKEIADRASEYGIGIGFEYHAGTLTDTRESALQLIREIDHPNVSLYWQPRNHGNFEENRRELQTVLPFLGNIHCFFWGPGGIKERLPLAEGKSVWREFLATVKTDGRDHCVLLEFIKDDDPDQLAADSKELIHLCTE